MFDGRIKSGDHTTTARFFDMLTRALIMPGKTVKPRSTMPEQAAHRKSSNSKLD